MLLFICSSRLVVVVVVFSFEYGRGTRGSRIMTFETRKLFVSRHDWIAPMKARSLPHRYSINRPNLPPLNSISLARERATGDLKRTAASGTYSKGKFKKRRLLAIKNALFRMRERAQSTSSDLFHPHPPRYAAAALAVGGVCKKLRNPDRAETKFSSLVLFLSSSSLLSSSRSSLLSLVDSNTEDDDNDSEDWQSVL